MAKYEKTVRSNLSFIDYVEEVTNSVLSKSMSATMEEFVDTTVGNAQCSVRTVERYSASGGNRVSMTMVFLKDGESDDIQVIATSTGGGGGLFKIIPWGENEFLQTLITTLEEI